ncbi:BTAD domain-containing putative transcriptional regulator [Yinghuangia sp. YIM S10712]|uniref:BTAD domain-containing putative transcriptional regulator n=1 Tax=Yinghuangia sp. YIM S10712 TaxID=3436930 RepID=UPI003F536DED
MSHEDATARPGVCLAVLGPLAATVGGREIALSGRRERMLLAALAASRLSPLAADRLVDALWSGAPPATAAAALHVSVSRLRSAFEPGRRPRTASSVIATTPGGYQLRLARGACDADRFAEAVDEAQDAVAAGNPARALARLDAGLALWRGAAYADVGDLPGPREEAARLEEMRLLASETRLDVLLSLGRHAEAVPDAELLAREHPFRERLAELWALALYRSGRQADALAVLARNRRRLAEELGVEPCPALRVLERDILGQAPRLDAGVIRAGNVGGLSGPGHGDAVGDAAVVPMQVGPAGRGTGPAPEVRDESGEPGTASTLSLPQPPPPAPPMSAPSADETPLVGRRAQLDAFDSALADIRAGRGALVLVSGEPGIGKTRLLTELRRRAELLGVPALWGRCHETDAAPAFWAWQAVLRDVERELAPPDAAPGAVDAGAAVFPWLGDESAVPFAGRPDTTGIGLPSAPLRVYEAVAHRLAGYAAARGGVVVVLDDVHWADPSSLHLLGYAAETLAEHPVLIAVSMRDSHPRADSALDACLATLARLHPLRLRLTGLAPDEIRELLRRSVGADIDGPTADLIHARADGNPFYARELARLLARDSDFDLTSPEIPDGIRDVVRRRVGLLDETARTILRVASVAGRDVDADLLAEVSGSPVDDVADSCDLAVAHGLLDETGPGGYRFTHALVRETLYDDLGAGRRGRLHGDIGSALEQWLPERPELLDSVAYHLAFGAAIRSTLADAAARHGIAAARQAELQYAYDDACARWQRTADLVAGRRGINPRVRFDIMHGLGAARRRVGDLAGARQALSEAIGLARGLDDAELLAAAAVACGGPELWNWREYADVDREVIAVLEQSRTALPDGPLRCRATANLAVELVYTWDALRADDLSAEAVAAARRLGDPLTLAYTLGCRYLATWRPGTAGDRLATAEELTALVEAEGHADIELAARFFRAVVLVELGRVTDADEQTAACDAIAARLRRSSTAIQLTWWHIARLLMDGRGDEVLARLPAAVRRHRATTLVGHAECEGTALAEAATLTGRLDETIPRLVELVDGSTYPVFHAVVARAAMAAGRLDLAAELLPPAPPEGHLGSWQSLAADCLRVEVLAALGHVDDLRRALARIRPHADTIAMFGTIGCYGSVRHFLGVGAAACGQPEAAATEFRHAIEANRAVGARVWLARSEEGLARLRKDS